MTSHLKESSLPERFAAAGPGTRLPRGTEPGRLLAEWNDTAAEYPTDLCVHQLFEAQAARTPDAAAVDYSGRQLTYRELNGRANQLAHFLRTLGVGPDVLVGICVERSLPMMVGLLGILKAGGAYVPLDPAFPRDRLAFMLEDSRARVLLTQESLLNEVPEHQAHAVCLDREWDKISPFPVANPDPIGTAHHLAYVLYTSGSTGKPKGVQIAQRAVVNFLCSMRCRPGLEPSDRLLAVTTLSFDIAGLELFLPLIVGATVFLASRETARDGRKLLESLTQSRATVLQATPATWRMLIQAGWSGTPGLKMLCGGEALPGDLARQLLTRGVSLWNLYGPTETTIWSTLHLVDAETDGVSVPIGRPIANTQIYILDERLQPVPIGTTGDLYIGGDGLARGYLNRAELTAEKFIANPFTQEPSGRLYKTGDLARYLDDGTLDFLGRSDTQVKIRGFRIELGEIETLLRLHPGVREAVVVAREDQPGDQRLVAYVTSAADEAPPAGDLHALLKEKLPEYMVPAAFVTLKALPLTPNGKVDRRALPAPGESFRQNAGTHESPRNSLELQLVSVWEKLLKVHPIGIKDNFFEAGGNSLLAVELAIEVEKLTGKRLPLATFFQAATVEQFADILREDGWKAPWSSLVPIQRSGSRPPFFCVHGMGANVLVFRDLVRHLGPDQPFYGLQPLGLDGRPAPFQTIEEIAAHYVKEIQTVQPQGPYYLGGLSFGGLVVFEMAQQLLAQGQAIALVVFFECYGPGRYKPFWQKVGIHVNGFVRMGLADKWGYVRDVVRRAISKVGRTIGALLPWRRLQPEFAVLAAANRVRANLHQARRGYVPCPYAGRITLFRASNQPRLYHDDPNLGWDGLVDGFDIFDVPGHHADIIQGTGAALVAEQLALCIK